MSLIHDLEYGARSLRRRPGLTLAACLSLALGIGVTTAIFTVLNAVALRPLPYKDSGRLVWLTQVLKKTSTDEVTITLHFLEWRRRNRTFVDLAGYNYQTRNLTGLAEPMQLRTAKASESLLPLLGVQPVLGRNFLNQEDYKGRDQVVLLGDGLWRRLGGDPGMVGRTINLDGAPFTVVGVLPPGFEFPGPDPVELITPLGKDEAAELELRSASLIMNVVGRLRAGVTIEQAKAELTALQSGLAVPAFRPTITVKMLALRDYLYGNVKRATLVLVAAAGFLLLIASANVGNLLLARWMQRDRELAVRIALGSSRARLVRQLLVESALLGLLSCGAGAALAFVASGPLLALSPYRLPGGMRVAPFDGRVLAFAVALGMLTTVLFGLLPALRATRVRLSEAIKVGEAAVVGGRGSLRLLSTVAAVEIAAMLVLSTGAGLMLQSFWKMRYTSLGFRPDRLVVATLNLPGSAARDQARQAAFVNDLVERTRNLPGVQLAALAGAGDLPPGFSHATNTFLIQGRDTPLGGARPIARYPRVSADYFAILGIPLVAGRLVQDSDSAGRQPVAVVNQALVRRYFDHMDPLGQRIRNGDDRPWTTIVGVVGDVKMSGLAAAPEPAIYFPYGQIGGAGEIGVLMRSPLDAGVIASEFRRAVASIDPNQPVAAVRAMSDRLSESVSTPRFTTVLLFAFAALALVLGLIGVYGVMGCRTRWQLRELAVRQALGAQRGDVIGHVLGQGMLIVVPGVLAGLTGSMALTRLLSGMLFEISAHDPLTFGAVAAILVAAALMACWIPAARAARTDPVLLLRHE